MKLYVVTEGDYSDYHICGIYSTPEKAERARALYHADSIEEWEQDAMPDAPEGMTYFAVAMQRDGTTVYVRPRNADAREEEYDWCPTWPTRWVNGKLESIDAVEFTMFARDEQHAVKIANERRAQLIAENLWCTDWETWVNGRGRRQ